jgi:hypothetical protein
VIWALNDAKNQQIKIYSLRQSKWFYYFVISITFAMFIISGGMLSVCLSLYLMYLENPWLIILPCLVVPMGIYMFYTGIIGIRLSLNYLRHEAKQQVMYNTILQALSLTREQQTFLIDLKDENCHFTYHLHSSKNSRHIGSDFEFLEIHCPQGRFCLDKSLLDDTLAKFIGKKGHKTVVKTYNFIT